MAGLGPFETAPALAVAVSGGADSVALVLLADRWAGKRGGFVVALTVDHGLRSESSAEALAVGEFLAGRGIAHRVLNWIGDKPRADVQAAARRARYRLLLDWCAANGVLHLLLGHHQDDQAETLLLRLGRGSGVDGLSAMAPVTARPQARLLRPLLAFSRARLEATVTQAGEPWIDDPSNRSAVYRRSRLRRLMPDLAAEGLDAARLAATAGRLARARDALEGATAGLAVRAVQLHPGGFARLDRTMLGTAPAEIALRLLARLCRTLSGGAFPPRLERLEGLLGALVDGVAVRRTSGGCLFAPSGGVWLVCREAAAAAVAQPLDETGFARWDGRFEAVVRTGNPASLGALGQDGWRSIRDAVPPPAIPRPAIATLPCLRDEAGVVAVPALGYWRSPAEASLTSIAFVPTFPLIAVERCLVPARGGIMS
jgi:tRNA(Ile)-lysidine synthase